MPESKISQKYKGKILGETTYSDHIFYAEDFDTPSKLISFLYEMNETEAILTEDGLKFLEEYYGLENVKKMILEEIENGGDLYFSHSDRIIPWLKTLGI